MKKALIAAALWLGIAGPALAVGGIADITIYDRAENRTLPVYYHAGRYFVAGKPGNEYPCRGLGLTREPRSHSILPFSLSHQNWC